MKKDLLRAMEQAISALKQEAGRKITLLHHNDTDGLSSGTILLNVFEKIGYTVERFSLEKPYPQVLDKLFARSGEIIVLADFAGKIAPLISEKNGQKNLVIILDHHPPESVDDERVHLLDGELFGLKGDRDISASAACYLFADLLLRSFGVDAEPDVHLGVLGAIGDGFFVNGALAGVNREVLDSAVNRGLMKVTRTESGEKYRIRINSREYDAAEICNVLDTVGGVGYYQNGTDTGIEICRNGVNSKTAEYAKDLKKKQDAIFSREIEHIESNLITTEHLQWFDVKDRFQPMGVKMIGVFCTLIKDMDFLDHTKYLAGFQRVPDEVPGFGRIEFDASKISMRVSGYLTEKIRSGQKPGLYDFLPEATAGIGGFSDACHRLSAATTVKVGQEDLLIEEMEKVLKKMEGEI